MERPRSAAPLYVGLAALISALVAHAAGWLALFDALHVSRAVGAGGWLLGGAGFALLFNGLALALAVVALVLRRARFAPGALPIALIAGILAVIGLVGVTLLALFGLILITPGVR